jgi:alpha-tubulin suppressor-like RCC1 family protein
VALTPSLITSRILEQRWFVDLAVGDEHCGAVTSMGNCYLWGQGCFGAVGRPAQILESQCSIVALFYVVDLRALTFEKFFLYQAVDRFSHPPNVKRPLKLSLPQAFFLFILFPFLSFFAPARRRAPSESSCCNRAAAC